MSRENLIALLGSMGRALDADLSLDEEDYTLVQVDGRIDLAIAYEGDTRTVLLVANCGRLPEAKLQAFLLEALTANFHWAGTGGATLAVDPHELTLHIQFREPTDQLGEARLYVLLGALVQNAKQWADRLAAGQWVGERDGDPDLPGAPDDDDNNNDDNNDASPPDAMPGFPSVSMIRI